MSGCRNFTVRVWLRAVHSQAQEHGSAPGAGAGRGRLQQVGRRKPRGSCGCKRSGPDCPVRQWQGPPPPVVQVNWHSKYNLTREPRQVDGGWQSAAQCLRLSEAAGASCRQPASAHTPWLCTRCTPPRPRAAPRRGAGASRVAIAPSPAAAALVWVALVRHLGPRQELGQGASAVMWNARH